MKLFNTNITDTVRFCQDQFGFELPSVLIVKKRDKPDRKLGSPSKNMTSDFAPEVAKYPKNPKPQITQNGDLDN